MTRRDGESIDRRKFLQRAAVVGTAVPAILTLTASGALAAPCSSATNRDDNCACTQNHECTNPAKCINQGVAGTICCIPNNQPVRSGSCLSGADASCCSKICNVTTDRCASSPV